MEPLRNQQFHHIGADRLFPRPARQGFSLRPLENDAVQIGLKESIERGLDNGLRILPLSTKPGAPHCLAASAASSRDSDVRSSGRGEAQAAPPPCCCQQRPRSAATEIRREKADSAGGRYDERHHRQRQATP
jgi:hypothetical protein